MAMVFETLCIEHVDLLFEFELKNRAWFESLIAPREESFYTAAGVANHIAEAEKSMSLGTHYFGVLLQDKQVVARGNLKDISLKKNSATVGYRVAEHAVGKGYATHSLTELVRIAQKRYSITHLDAFVLDNNPASKAVLEKLQFKACSHQEPSVLLNGAVKRCYAYEYTL